MLRQVSAGVAFLFLLGALAAASAVQASEFFNSVTPATPTDEETFDLRAMRWFGDTGYASVGQSIDVDGFSIEIDAVIQDLHRPGWVFAQVESPYGAFFDDYGPLPAGTYDVTANYWLTAWPSTEPLFLLDTASFNFNVESASAANSLLGDYNNDDSIDGADYTVWRDTMISGGSALMNDPTPGSVTESDFEYWRDHYGDVFGSGAGSPGAIPEPGSFWLLLAAAGPLIAGRRHGLR